MSGEREPLLPPTVRGPSDTPNCDTHHDYGSNRLQVPPPSLQHHHHLHHHHHHHTAVPYSDSRSDLGQEGCEFEIKPDSVHVPHTRDHRFRFKTLWAFTGPGFLMSVAYLDPGNIESDLQSGAIAEYKLLWVLMWSTVMGLMLQLLAARLGCVTGMNLAQVCRVEYSRFPRIVLWLMAEIAIIGSDIQEVIGSAIAISLLSAHKIPLWAGVLITGVDTFTFLFLESAGLRKLEALFGALITTMAACFLYMYIMVGPDQLEILKGLWFPWCQDCDRAAIKQLVGIIGAVIMPHNIYLHSALVLSRDVDRKDKEAVREANMYYSIESAVALFVSFLVNLFVVTVFAAAFSDPKYGENASLRVAGDWLYENYGLAMKIMWGIGLLAAGQSSTMTGTYAGQFVMEGFLHLHWAKWKRVLLTRSISIVPTVIVAIVTSSKLDDMTQWLNVLQSVQLPFALIPIMHFTNSQRIMGEFRNTLMVRMVVGFVVFLVIGVNMYLMALYVTPGLMWYVYVIISVVVVVYLTFLFFLVIGIDNYWKLKLLVLNCCGCDVDHAEGEIERRKDLTYPLDRDSSSSMLSSDASSDNLTGSNVIIQSPSSTDLMQ